MRQYQCLTVLLAVSTSFTLPAQGQRRVIERPMPRERTLESERWRESRPDSEAERLRKLFGWSPTPERPVGLLPAPKPTPVLHLPPYVRSEPDRIREAQTKLAERGYLDPRIDVDGKIGPRTRQALAKCQRDRNLTVTGDLDFATEGELGIARVSPLLQRFRALRIPHVLETPDSSAQYRFLDASGHVLFYGDDLKLLVSKLNDSSIHERICIEMKGFSEDKAEAFAASLRIQQRQIDPSVSIVVLPQDRVTRENLFTPGIRLDVAPDPIEQIGDSGRVSPVLTFRRRIGEQERSFGVRIVAASIELYRDLCDAFRSLLPSLGFDEKRSLDQLVKDAWKKLQLKYPDLSREQLRIELLHQFGSSLLVRSFREVSATWS